MSPTPRRVPPTPTPADVGRAQARARGDWFERLTRQVESYEGTVDVAALRLLTWCAVVLALTYGCARTWSDSIVR
jgi:hypothetical protein